MDVKPLTAVFGWGCDDPIDLAGAVLRTDMAAHRLLPTGAWTHR